MAPRGRGRATQARGLSTPPAAGAQLPTHTRSTTASRESSAGPSPAPRSRFPTPQAPAEDSDDDPFTSRPSPVLASPVKRRQRQKAKTIKDMTDEAVWDKPDQEIVDDTFALLTSAAYDHFIITLERDHAKKEMSFKFTCKYDSAKHPPHLRLRSKTAIGTGNLLAAIRACDKRRGVKSIAHPAADSNTLPYSEENHRALVALRCAESQRPYNMVEDRLYAIEVDMLRPGTVPPKAATVSRDVQRLYFSFATHVATYFMALNSAFHLVLDGWTAPIVASYLGIVIVWATGGKIYRAVLDFIRLKQAHTGEYLAQVLADCLKRFGIAHLLFSLCMDNAGNCNKLAATLPRYIPTFRGSTMRVRCIAHILNLIAKIFLSFFFKKRRVKSTASTSTALEGGDVVVISADDIDDPEADEAVAEEFEIDDDALAEDDGHATHNHAVVTTLRDQAIEYMSSEHGVEFTQKEAEEAWQILPRVAGLARRVHDSTTLKETFDQLISQNKELEGSRRALERRVATRWNSDLACLESHLHFRKEVEQLTGVSSNRLHAYRLSVAQWDLAECLADALKASSSFCVYCTIFEEPTRLFSQAQVPLIVDVLPLLYDLKLSLEAIRDDPDEGLSPIFRVAAHAAIMMVDKYTVFTEECEIYYIAIVMCPDRKLEWFKNRNYTPAQVKKIKTLVVKRWTDTYQAPSSGFAASSTRTDTSTSTRTAGGRWNKKADAAPSTSTPFDHITTYLKEPIISSDIIESNGGYVEWWTKAQNNRPTVAKMALEYVTTPASSVDAERAFSTGRRQINFMQHNMSSTSFRGKMALGSWTGTPLDPGIEEAAKVIRSSMPGAPQERSDGEGNSDSDD